MKRPPLKTRPKEKPDWLGQLHEPVHKDLRANRREMLARLRKREKAAARFARQFHSAEFVEWMQAKPCCSCSWWILGKMQGFPHRLTEISHVRSRGAGGTWKDTVPQCQRCHSEFHQKGRLSFCQSRGWPLERLSELAAGYAREWEARSG